MVKTDRQQKMEVVKELCLKFGEHSLRKAVNEYVEHYHHDRNYQGLDNLIPFPYAGEIKGRTGSVVKFERRMVLRASGSEGY